MSSTAHGPPRRCDLPIFTAARRCTQLWRSSSSTPLLLEQRFKSILVISSCVLAGPASRPSNIHCSCVRSACTAMEDPFPRPFSLAHYGLGDGGACHRRWMYKCVSDPSKPVSKCSATAAIMTL